MSATTQQRCERFCKNCNGIVMMARRVARVHESADGSADRHYYTCPYCEGEATEFHVHAGANGPPLVKGDLFVDDEEETRRLTLLRDVGIHPLVRERADRQPEDAVAEAGN